MRVISPNCGGVKVMGIENLFKGWSPAFRRPREKGFAYETA